MLRGVLVSEIFKKTFALEQTNAKELAAATLMSTDVEGISMNLLKFHEIWANIIEFALGTYLLTTVIGKATILVIFPGLSKQLFAFANTSYSHAFLFPSFVANLTCN